ncbi:MAG: hypothetical protein ACRYG5_10030 [Janthinobacterium lividum]
MSIRTLIEVNHDHLTRLLADPDALARSISDLCSAQHLAELNLANSAGRPHDLLNGLRLVLQRHHTTDVTVSTDYAKVRL